MGLDVPKSADPERFVSDGSRRRPALGDTRHVQRIVRSTLILAFTLGVGWVAGWQTHQRLAAWDCERVGGGGYDPELGCDVVATDSYVPLAERSSFLYWGAVVLAAGAAATVTFALGRALFLRPRGR